MSMINKRQNEMSIQSEVPIILHADDYGETYNTCIEMIELLKGGYLDGISVITNMRDYERYADMFMKAIPDMHHLPLINVHINPVEGRHLQGNDRLENPDDHILTWTWSSLFFTSYRLPTHSRDGERMRYREVYRELEHEISMQLKAGAEFIQMAQNIAREAGIPYTPQNIRIDSHQHSHMIPIVWKALTEVIVAQKLKVDYIRNAHEPLLPFLKHRRCINILGFIKNRVLAFNAPKVERYIKRNIGVPNYLCGVMMSGHMDMVRVGEILPDMTGFCHGHGYGLEVNIHPAMMLDTEVTEEIPYDSAMSFYTSPDRHTEALTVRSFSGIIGQEKKG